jgi:hypothetical protein
MRIPAENDINPTIAAMTQHFSNMVCCHAELCAERYEKPFAPQGICIAVYTGHPKYGNTKSIQQARTVRWKQSR